jgi:hypothetical protein
MIDLEKEAEKYAGIKTSINDEDEKYFNSHGVALAKGFIAGANSKYIQVEKLKFALEQLYKFRESTFGKGKNVIKYIEQQLKQLKGEIDPLKQEIKSEGVFNDEKRQGVKELTDTQKHETVEEAAEIWVFETNGHKWSNNNDTAGDNYGSFIEGAKWQSERMYSEEDMKEAFKGINKTTITT